MKNLFFLMLLIVGTFMTANATNVIPQGNPGLDAISTALSAGDADALSKFFGDNVEISISDDEQVYPKAKATEIVRGFFTNNKPKSFNQVHKGNSRENSDQYCIGNLTAANGNYRVYLYLKTTGTVVTIQEIRFDKE